MARILMTGCSTGFGATVRRLLIEDKHEVVGWGLNGPDVDIDFSIEDDPDRFYRMMKSQGPFSVLLNNAGMMEVSKFKHHSTRHFSKALRVNLAVPYSLMYTFYQLSNSTDEYRIINTCSMAIKTPPRECPGYVASKAGLEALTRALAREFAGSNFIFANIAPNAVENTAMMEDGLTRLQIERRMTLTQAQQYMAGPAGQLIQHEEMYKVFKFAIEEMPAAMSGTTLWIPNACGA